MLCDNTFLLQRANSSEWCELLATCAVIGCGELAAPPGAHVRRDDAGLMIICDASRETFRLVCVGRRWTGKLHNCTQPGE